VPRLVKEGWSGNELLGSGRCHATLCPALNGAQLRAHFVEAGLGGTGIAHALAVDPLDPVDLKMSLIRISGFGSERGRVILRFIKRDECIKRIRKLIHRRGGAHSPRRVDSVQIAP